MMLFNIDDAEKMRVDSAGVDITGDLTVSSNLTINGTTTTINSTTVTVDDPILTLGGDSVPGSDDNKDRGIEFRYHDGTNARLGFMGYDYSANKFTMLTAATNTSEVFSGTKGLLVADFVGIADSATKATTLDTTSNGFVKTTGGNGSLSYVSLTSTDIPSLDAAKITSGTFGDAPVSYTHLTLPTNREV